jgi:Sec-independent protein secretion pathway component TatC
MGDALISSLKFVSRFFLDTIKVLTLLIFIEIRTIFNVLIIFLLPFILVSIGGFLAEGIFGIIAQVTVGLIFLSLAAAISGILFVYKNIAWTLAFLQLRSIKEEEDKD